MKDNFATAYRPSTFAEVVGQDVTKSVLTKIALSSGITVRSIFLKGSYGSGKSTMARIFGRALNCSNFQKTHDVCNECNGCHEGSILNSQTYWEFDSTAVGNVEAIRALHDKLTVLPPNNMRRLVVFDEAHAASSAALNGLLKLIEDGVPNTIFMFCSTEDILNTIKSRSINLEVTTIPPAIMAPRIQYVAEQENISVDDSIISKICMKSEGHMRNALSLLQLYALGGEVVLRTPLTLIANFFKDSISHNPKALEILVDILKYPTTDIVQGIDMFIKTCFTAQPSSPYYIFYKSGAVYNIFSFIYNNVGQQALKSEVGTELLLRAFYMKCNPIK